VKYSHNELSSRRNKETEAAQIQSRLEAPDLQARLLCWTFDPPPDEAIPGDRPKINGAAFVAD